MRYLIPSLLALAVSASAATISVRDHGAAGDGTTKDTAAIQQAIDACAEAGGGRVVFPKGRYLSGSLQLKSKVVLVIEPEAVLLGSADLADFKAGPLLGATEATEIGIEGGGTIDGQGESWWDKVKTYTGEPWHGTAQFEYKARKRPSFIRFTRCSGVVVRNVTLTQSPSWTLHLLRCQRVMVDHVVIRNPLYGPNTDGIDVNSCIDVTIRNCDIVTGDDGVVLKSTEPGHDHPSRNITVEDCRIWSACNGLKIGTETHDDFSDITFRNCHLYSDSERGIDRTIAGIAIESVDGAKLSRIRVSNITMSGVRTPIFVRLGHRGGNGQRTRQVEPRVPGEIEDVVIRNVKAEKALLESSITGIPDHPVRNLLLENIDLTYEGGADGSLITDDVPDETVIRRYPEASMFGRLPAFGLYCRHVQDLALQNVVCRWEKRDGRPLLVADDVQRLLLDRVGTPEAPAEFPVFWLTRVRDIQFRTCAAPADTKVYVAYEGTDPDTVTFRACDTAAAKTPLLALPAGGLLSHSLPLLPETSPGLVLIDPTAMWLTPPMQTVENAIEAPLGHGRDRGSARCRFTVSEPGDYAVWVHVLAPTGEANSFFLSIDQGTPSLSDVVRTGEWHWDMVHNRRTGPDDAAPNTVFALATGEHLLHLRNRESGTRIDRIAIVRAGLPFPSEGK